MEYIALAGRSFCLLALILLLRERAASKRLRGELEDRRLRSLESVSAPAVLAHEIRAPFTPGSAPNPGTGIGMTVAGRIVEAHGGRLMIDSVEGRGTAVHVRLPGGRP